MSKPLIFLVIDAPVDRLGLSAVEKTVLIAIVSHYNAKRNGAEVWPSKARLQALTGCSEPAVRRAIRKLEELAYLKVQSHSGKSNCYTINFDVIQAATDPRHTDGGNSEVIHNPRQRDGGTPVTQTRDPSLTDARTANRTAKGNSNLTFGCSARLKVSEGPQQRKLAVHGVVAETAGKLRLADHEEPAVRKPLARAREGPG